MRFVVVLLLAVIGFIFFKVQAQKVRQGRADIASYNITERTEGVWLQSYQEALATAKAKGLPVLMLFTGSDWCEWCLKLEGEVFAQPQFKQWQPSHAVLLKIDFPRNKAQSDALKKQNSALAQSYKVEGYPTVILIDAEGTPIAKTGYMEGGATAYIDQLNKLLGR